MESALLDTDTLSELLKQRSSSVRRHALEYLRDCGPIAFSAVTRFEILRGLKQKRAERQLAQFAEFCADSLVIPLTEAIFDRAADLWVDAYRYGHPRNDADILIAATALDSGLVLVSGNLSHYSWIADLIVRDWRAP